MLYFLLRYDVDVTTLIISRYQSKISTLWIINTFFVAYSLVWVATTAASSDITQIENNLLVEGRSAAAEWTAFYRSVYVGDFR